jgi:maltose O-acetyltransferase
VFINSNCVILDGTEVRIGDYSLLGPGVHIYVADHSLDPNRRLDVFTKPIIIGKRVWIGGNVTITSGVTIGDGVTIGAGSVVTKDIEPYSVAVGVPARVIKKVQPSDDIVSKKD